MAVISHLREIRLLRKHFTTVSKGVGTLDTKTTCFGIVEGLSFTVKYHSYITKTSCFGIMEANGTFRRTSILPNKLTINELEVKVELSRKIINLKSLIM